MTPRVLYLFVRSVSNNLPTKRVPNADEFTSEFYRIFNEEMIPILHNLFQEMEAEIILPNFLNEAGITPISELNKDVRKVE